eukprot:5176699-Alexandrium_andersonii.AAC.1
MGAGLTPDRFLVPNQARSVLSLRARIGTPLRIIVGVSDELQSIRALADMSARSTHTHGKNAR